MALGANLSANQCTAGTLIATPLWRQSVLAHLSVYAEHAKGDRPSRSTMGLSGSPQPVGFATTARHASRTSRLSSAVSLPTIFLAPPPS
jgi:hypothetical protein